MSSTQNRIPVTPVLTSKEILPETPVCELPEPFSTTANFINGELIFNCSVKLPSQVQWSDVTVEQYYDSSNANPLQFYFVYTLDGTPTGNPNQFDLAITGLKDDESGSAIPYEDISSLIAMVVNKDPKTSRGMAVGIRQAGDL